MTAKVKRAAKNTSITVAIIGAVTSCGNAYLKMAEQKSRQDQFEIFFSNEQDRINCQFDSLKIKHNCKP